MSSVLTEFTAGPLRVFTVAVGAAVLLGCGTDGPPLADVSGRVTLDGRPVRGAILTFYPEAENGSPSYGGTDKDGYYQLMFTDIKSGAFLGRHKVQIAVQKISQSEADEMRASGIEVPETFVEIPAKYREPGALTAEVADDDNEINFELVSN